MDVVMMLCEVIKWSCKGWGRGFEVRESSCSSVVNFDYL